MGINHHHWSTIGDLQILVYNENLGVSNENMVSPTKIWGLQCKSEDLRETLGVSNENMGVSNENMGVSYENMGVSNENLGVSNENLSPVKNTV